MKKQLETPNTLICEVCKRDISHSKDLWPDYGVCIGGCSQGLPPLEEGDIIVDRTYHAHLVTTMEHFRGYNIMTVQRPKYVKNGTGRYLIAWVSIWTRKE